MKNKNTKRTVFDNARKRRFGKRFFIALFSVSIICCFAVGGTVAWLVDQTAPIKNTFTYGDINITLSETDTGDNDGDLNTNEYIMVPGEAVAKDPVVTVQAGSESNWLFVQLNKSANFDDFMTYDIADGWILLDGEENVYYQEVTKLSEEQQFGVIKDNIVTVKEDVTKQMLNSLTEDTLPTLTITAFAVQRANIESASDAWALVE